MAKKISLGRFNEIPEGGLKRIKIGSEDVAVYKISGKIFVTANLCPHEQCPIDENHRIEFDVVECTCHGSKFDIKTGSVMQPPAVESLKTYRVEMHGDEIFITV